MPISKFKSKGDLFEGTAKSLNSRDEYLAVPHSAYYSCVLLMKHIWHEVMKKSDAELEALISSAKNDSIKEKGVHSVLLNEICNFLDTTNISEIEKRNFRSKLPQLKKCRIIADYKDRTIDHEFADTCISYMTAIRTILNKVS